MPSLIRSPLPLRATLSAVALTALLTLAGCTGDGGGGSDNADKISGTVTPSVTASVSLSATPSPSVSPSPIATTAVPTPAPAGTQSATPTRTPAPSHMTTAPAPTPTPVGDSGDILAPSGNHYKAGQFCKEAHLGLTTHDGNGRLLRCAMKSGKPHWGYA
ncbi:hypothetical protein QMK19_14795 [Streptomyces sp. H10-C2]|uniref:hypothetical protein n=1 Tax=unclassified Streptomyces TaxID=2593676 RepID=UPI0024BA48AF|nr:MULTISPECIES: hypothetical protein [unclassified Streptomyces]MDJ0341322.1 hypothetical protein [Streptomyces sp. PH10-H1]MDJ0370917.1 hypothetical protein [Streptomyces sp. H10-C2]